MQQLAIPLLPTRSPSGTHVHRRRHCPLFVSSPLPTGLLSTLQERLQQQVMGTKFWRKKKLALAKARKKANEDKPPLDLTNLVKHGLV